MKKFLFLISIIFILSSCGTTIVQERYINECVNCENSQIIDGEYRVLVSTETDTCNEFLQSDPYWIRVDMFEFEHPSYALILPGAGTYEITLDEKGYFEYVINGMTGNIKPLRFLVTGKFFNASFEGDVRYDIYEWSGEVYYDGVNVVIPDDAVPICFTHLHLIGKKRYVSLDSG